jgi:hypothetical protein
MREEKKSGKKAKAPSAKEKKRIQSSFLCRTTLEDWFQNPKPLVRGTSKNFE